MTFDQKIQLANTVGIWFTGIATFLAVVVALYLAKKGERVELKAYANVGHVKAGGLAFRCICIEATNLGERNITIEKIGWTVAKKKTKEFAYQPVHNLLSTSLPSDLSHGKSARFLLPLDRGNVPQMNNFVFISGLDNFPNGHRPSKWVQEDILPFIGDDKNIKTFKAIIATSIGKTFEVKLEQELLDFLNEQNIPQGNRS